MHQIFRRNQYKSRISRLICICLFRLEYCFSPSSPKEVIASVYYLVIHYTS
ncbi:unnamed protein product [Linum tenue]|uniref:Uncharacterized protein n=1 Tax=Linum tenue TaxID=586396 RepID=A0AAV0R7X2_9ROSI|nr:unnamed protein product [Linum tenue]